MLHLHSVLGNFLKAIGWLLLLTGSLRGQGPGPVRDAAELQILLDRLQVVGSVLYVAAHPDDENTAVLAALAKGRKLRTAYLSLTRGGGGQNLIGPELDDALAAIRTQELLAARRVDGAEQLFTRAVDFGYSKTPEETLRFWGREEILADVVRAIRNFQPDVILTRFPTDGRGGHGHHTASAILAVEAFSAAADPSRFPEQLGQGRLRPWQAKRILFNFFRFQDGAAAPANTVPFDVGAYDPLLGRSYAELAAEGRSQHRSQGFGVIAPRGSRVEYFEHLAGSPAKVDLLEGVDLTWNRIPGGARVGELLAQARAAYQPERPTAALAALLEAKAALAALPAEPLTTHKGTELLEAIRCTAGIWAEAISERPAAGPGEPVPVTLGFVVRSSVPVHLDAVDLEGDGGSHPAKLLAANQPWKESLSLAIPAGATPTNPSWATGSRAFLHGLGPAGFENFPEDPPAFSARFRGRILDQPFELRLPVLHRYRDPVLGERYQPFVVQPPVLVQGPTLAQIFPDTGQREIQLEVTPTRAAANGKLKLQVPAGWRVEPSDWPFNFTEANTTHRLSVKIQPPQKAAQGELAVFLEMDGQTQPAFGKQTIAYPHIPTQALFPPARLRLVRADIRVKAQRIGYVMGAGDDIPQALRLLGCEVEMLTDEALAARDLGAFDAVVVGIRAFNTRPALARAKDRLLDYVAKGGTEIVLYQVNGAFPGTNAGLATDSFGPAPFKIGRERVTDEASPVRFLAPGHPVLAWPNAIGPADFDGWVQERGLYFAASWDAKYTAVLSMSDPGEKPLDGGLLVASHGKGQFVFTGLAFFRQLPEGIPGAYRLFANILSLGSKQMNAGK
jgi:LmbE family N-acetylglucosaminyl deacetylase